MDRGLCSCASNKVATRRRQLALGGVGDLQTLLTPFGTGWKEEFLMTGFENVSRLYVACACFH